MSIKFFNKKAAEWDNYVNHDRDKIKKAVDELPFFLSPDILDAGTGTGVLIPYLVDKYKDCSITAIDYAPDMIKIAKQKYGKFNNVDFKIGDIYGYNFRKKYSIITAYSVFPHFIDKKRILNIFYNNLNSGGICIIFHSQSRKEINKLHKNAGQEVERDNLPPAIEVSQMAEKIGFKLFKTVDNSHQYKVIIQKN